MLPRSSPRGAGVSSRAVGALLDRLAERSLECHSLMVVRRGRVVAEGWWAPYTAERPHLLYSLTKSFTSVAVGLAVGDGLLSVDDLVVDVLADHVPENVSAQGRRITVHHLLSMTSGHAEDSLGQAWRLEPHDLVKGFLRVPFADREGTRHMYDNATTFLLARIVERVTGRGLPEFLDERLFRPLGIKHAEWDRVASGAAFGFHGLHLTTEAVAAFGELLREEGRDLIPYEWIRLATRRHVETRPAIVGGGGADWLCGYGYQFWMSRHGYFGEGNLGQMCLVVPEHELVIAMTAGTPDNHAIVDALWECLLPGLDQPDSAEDDEFLTERMRGLSLPYVPGTAGPDRALRSVEPDAGGWLIRLDPGLSIAAGYREWRESAPLGRPVVASAAWQGDTFVADLYVITTPHRVRLTIEGDTTTMTWNYEPLTTTDLTLHLTSPLMTRPDVS
ncbi:beta-lactamase family protein [Actinoplanes bogorensis]|uniref:Beta-lactamase family protein n=1 Tax=Paractinoplanes bogorensis TaxID=1610840 RepID=A0ABS5YT77_9ACTN|nr:beta-lactamase family protein [Actinoplanes bogorensis]